MIVWIFSGLFGVAVASVAVIVLYRGRPDRVLFVWTVGALILLIVATVVVVFEAGVLERDFHKRSWPRTRAVVLSSKVIGERAFRPYLRIQYTIKEETYRRDLELTVPSFGGRINRLDVAEKTASQYSPGDSLRVFVDPADPRNVVIQNRLSHANLLKLGTAGFVWIASFVVLVLSLMAFFKSHRTFVS
jgi:hypothetical protein